MTTRWTSLVPSWIPEALAKCVAPILPWATFGYGGPQQDQFQRDPRAMYRR